MSGSSIPIPPRRSIHIRSWITAGWLSLLLMGVTAAALYLIWANRLPSLPPESRVAPRPNGYDACLAAISQLTFTGKTDPSQAARLQNIRSMRGALARDHRALDELRRAIRLPFMAPPVRSNEGSGDAYLAGFLDAALSFVGESRVALADRRPGLAIDRALDAVELGSRVGGGGTLDSNTIGRMCSFVGVVQAEKCVPLLSAGEARAAGSRLDRIARQFPSFADAAREERRSRLAAMRELYTGQAPVWLHGRAPSANAMRIAQVRLFLAPKPLLYMSLDHDLRAAVAYAEKPWPQRPRALPLSNPVIGELTEHAGFAFTTGEAQLDILRLELALHESRQRHGHYPARFAALMPEFLSQVPLDPFTGGPLVYRSRGRGYQLYSLGPGGSDDGGRPIAAAALTSLRSNWFTGPDDLASGRSIRGDLPAGALGGR